MENPLISVIVPIYKVEAFLPQCIDSLIEQSYTDLEIILVDDGSPDNCAVICDDYALKNNTIKVIHKKNGGLISARKAGILAARGEYVCYVDGDDWMLADHFERVADAIKQHKADVVVHGYTIASEINIENPPKGIPYGFFNRVHLEQSVIPVMLSMKPFYNCGIIPSVWGKAFKRDLLFPFQINVPDDVTIGEDAIVSYPAIMRANSMEVIDDCGYMYRKNENSMTQTYDSKLANNLPSLIHYFEKTIHDDPLNKVIYPQFCDYTCFMTLGAISNELKGTKNVKEAIEKLQKIVNDPIIIEAVQRKESPQKVKMAFNIVQKRQYFFASLMKKKWHH